MILSVAVRNAFFLLACGAVFVSVSRGQTLELTDVLAAHTTQGLEASDLLATPEAEQIAWIEKEQELWVARAPQFTAQRLLTLSGEETFTAAFPAPDGKTLWYFGGEQTPEFPPHPARDTRLFGRIDLTTGQLQILARGSEVPTGTPVFAPDGKSFASAAERMIYQYQIIGSTLQRRPLLSNDPQHYAAISVGALTYSPDGSKLAFVSMRKAGQSYVGIIDLASGDYRYIEPGIFRDLSPAWSPDSMQLAFVRMPGNWTRAYRFTPVNEGAPWEIWLASAKEGTAKRLWRADSGTGSVFRPFAIAPAMEGGLSMEDGLDNSQLFWTTDGDILFPWEKTGWVSLYAVSVNGETAARHLTPGEGEIALPTLDEANKSVIYSSNIGDLPRLHLWRVSLKGGTPEALTRGTGVEHSPKLLTGGHLAYIGNFAGRMPNYRHIRLNNGKTLTVSPTAETVASQSRIWDRFVTPEVIAVKAQDGITVQHLLFVPKEKPPAAGFPVIVASKGGPDGRVSPGNGAYSAWGQYAVTRGFIFVDINYRGGNGFGLNYRLPAGRGATGGSEVNDLEALALHLKSRNDVNGSKIGIVGGSYGGHMVSLALSRLPQHYAAGVHMSGVADWVIEMKKDQQDGWASAPPEFIRLSERLQIEDLAYNSSPQSRIAAWRAPTLFTMGERDTAGHMESIIDLGYRLIAQGTHVEFSIAPEAGHSGPRARPPEKAMAFFERFLKESTQP
jgi:dipeptidyl aminopeptidase/acylaminoacyl peptidase